MLACFCEDPMPLDSDDHDIDIRATKCGHIFHANCLLRWLRINSTCPQCRTPNTMIDQIRLYPTLSDKSEQESVVNETLESLEKTRSELNDMTVLCKKKDEMIAKLKKEADNKYKYKIQKESLIACLQNLSGESLDIFFDDPEIFNSTINTKQIGIFNRSQ